MDSIKVYWLPIANVRGKEEYLLSVLPKDRVEKAKRFVREGDRALSLAAGYLVYRYVGEYYVDPFGKPRSDKVFFNLSHSRDVAALALSPRLEVGLDIEKNRVEEPDTLAEYCLSDQETEVYEKGASFLSFFTAKESLAKAEGCGIGNKIKEIPALPFDGEVEYLHKKYFRHALTIGDHFLSLTARGEDYTIEMEETNVE